MLILRPDIQTSDRQDYRFQFIELDELLIVCQNESNFQVALPKKNKVFNSTGFEFITFAIPVQMLY